MRSRRNRCRRAIAPSDLDVQVDGGTHVASTSGIGRIEVTKPESKGKGFRRLRIAIGDAKDA